jgi:hypothetical protein
VAHGPSQQESAAGSLHIGCGTRHAVEMAREGVPLVVIQRQLGDDPVSTSTSALITSRRCSSRKEQ